MEHNNTKTFYNVLHFDAPLLPKFCRNSLI